MIKRYKKHLDRLAQEWIQHGKIIIAVDFDDTISPWKFRDEDDIQFYDDLILRIKRWKSFGAYIVIFSSCSSDRYSEIRRYCQNKGLEIDNINKTPVDDIPWGKYGKIYANVFLDDRAGIDETIEIIERALVIKESKTNPDKYFPEEIA